MDNNMSTVHDVASTRENEDKLRELEYRYRGTIPRNVVEFYLTKVNASYFSKKHPTCTVGLNQNSWCWNSTMLYIIIVPL